MAIGGEDELCTECWTGEVELEGYCDICGWYETEC